MRGAGLPRPAAVTGIDLTSKAVAYVIKKQHCFFCQCIKEGGDYDMHSNFDWTYGASRQHGRQRTKQMCVIWPNTIFVEEDFLVAGAEAHGKVFRVHQVVIDEGRKAPKHLADGRLCTTTSSSATPDTTTARPATCKEHGGKHCLMKSATVRQVVTWLQKFGDQIPEKLGHVRSSS
jgi:hypothetical protein